MSSTYSNVHGISSRNKQNQLKRCLFDERLEVRAVQETKLSEDEGVAKAVDPFLPFYEASLATWLVVW